MSPNAFWNELAACVREGRPGVWRRPLGGPVASPEEAFDWIVAAAHRVRERDARIEFRPHVGGRAVEPDASRLPGDGDRSTAGYLRRLDPATGEALLAINHLQAASPAAWRRALSLLAPLHARLGVGAGGAMFDLFAGAYRVGPFGVHKDQFDVVTFVVEGRKRFLAWPFERFADRPDVPAGCALRPAGLAHLDYAPDRADAVVLEGDPGDVFFWPAEWWHVAESDRGHCTTLSLGLSREETPLRHVEAAARELAEEGALDPARRLRPTRGDAAASLDDARASLDRLASDDALRRRVDEKLLAHLAAHGMGVAPDPLPREAVVLDGPLSLAAPGAVVWRARGDELTWSAGGAVYRYPAAPALVRALERVATAEPFTVSEVEALADEAVTPAALRHLVATLATRHALRAG